MILSGEKRMKEKIKYIKNKFFIFHRKGFSFLKKLFILVVIAIIIFVVNVLFGSKITSILSDPENTTFTNIVVLLAALLGAVVGGIITYLINIKSIFINNHIKSAIINKKVIYEPLLIEFKQIRKRIEKESVLYFSHNAEHRTIGSTPFETWLRIKNDARFYQIPDFYQKECLDIEQPIEKYKNKIKEVEQTFYELFITTLKEKGHKIENINRGLRSFFRCKNIIEEKDFIKTQILDRNILGLTKIDDELQKVEISRICNEKLLEIGVVKEFEIFTEDLKKYLDIAIISAERILKRISTVYEKRNIFL